MLMGFLHRGRGFLLHSSPLRATFLSAISQHHPGGFRRTRQEEQQSVEGKQKEKINNGGIGGERKVYLFFY